MVERKRKAVQVMLTSEEEGMLVAPIKRYGISKPNAVRRAIAVDQIMRNLRESGIEGLELGVRDRKTGEVVYSIPVDLIPRF